MAHLSRRAFEVLVPVADIHDVLACPVCGGSVTVEANTVSCARCPRRFETLGETPVLLDFESSIIDRDAFAASSGASAVPRGLSRRRTKVTPIVAENLRRLRRLIPEGSTVLIVGGASDEHGLVEFYEAPDLRVVGFDVYRSPLTTFIADAHSMPLKTGSVDVVVAQAVLEHVVDPARVVAEIHRVLRTNGLVYAETAFMQQVHEGPFDFYRCTPIGHRWLFRDFSAIEEGEIGGPGLSLVWSLDYLIRGVLRSRTAGIRSRRVTRILARLDDRIPPSWRSDAATAVYFIGRKGDRGITLRELLSTYRGTQAREAS